MNVGETVREWTTRTRPLLVEADRRLGDLKRAEDAVHEARRQYHISIHHLHESGMFSYAEIGKMTGVSRGRAQQMAEAGRRAIAESVTP